MSQEIVVQIENLTMINDDHKVLDDLCLTLENNRIIGVLGPNGSGKTTLFNILASLEKSYRGKVLIKDKAIGYQTRKIVAYCPSVIMLDKNLNVQEACTMFANHYKDFNFKKFSEISKEIQIDGKIELKKLTCAMLQQIQMALVLSRDVDVYLLDEPIQDVDMLKRKELVDLIKKYKNSDSLIIIASHHIDDFASIYDDVLIIEQGQLIQYGSMEDICLKENKTLIDVFVEVFK